MLLRFLVVLILFVHRYKQGCLFVHWQKRKNLPNKCLKWSDWAEPMIRKVEWASDIFFMAHVAFKLLLKWAGERVGLLRVTVTPSSMYTSTWQSCIGRRGSEKCRTQAEIWKRLRKKEREKKERKKEKKPSTWLCNLEVGRNLLPEKLELPAYPVKHFHGQIKHRWSITFMTSCQLL